MSSLKTQAVQPGVRHRGAVETSGSRFSLGRLRLFLVLLGLSIAVASPILQFRLMTPDLPWPRSDMAPVALGVQATLHGRDPYSPQVTREIQIAFFGHPLAPRDHGDENHFAYPAYAAIVLAPLAILAWTRSELLFLIVMPFLTAASVLLWLSVAGIALSRVRLAVVVLLTLASWPVMWALRLCQITLLVALFVAVGCWLIRKRHDMPAGIVLSLATIKPQTAGPLVIWLLVWTCMQRRWSLVTSFICATSALLLATQWIAPGWFPRWLATAAAYAHYTHIRPILQYVFGRWIGGLLMAAFVAVSCLVLWRMRKCCAKSAEFGVAISLVLALTLSIFPTTVGMSYNDVLLLPALLILLHKAGVGRCTRAARWITIGLLLAVLAAVPLQVLGECIWGYTKMWTVVVLVPLVLLPACTLVALALYANELRLEQSKRPERHTPPAYNVL